MPAKLSRATFFSFMADLGGWNAWTSPRAKGSNRAYDLANDARRTWAAGAWYCPEVMSVLEPSFHPPDELHRRVQHRYRRPPEPVSFPASEDVPETKYHLERRTALYQSIKHEIAASATIGSEQFVYWDPTTAKKNLAPDVFVRLGVPDEPFRTWKTWERGAPDLGVEIVSESDEGELDWSEKLTR